MEQKLTYNLAVRLFSDEKCFRARVCTAAAEGAGAAFAAGGSHVHEHGLFQGVDHHQNAQAALGFPLLHSITGGRGGGGAELCRA